MNTKELEEYFKYMQEIGKENDISKDIFTVYDAQNTNTSIPYINQTLELPQIKVNESFKIQNPLISSTKKNSIKAPMVKVEAPIPEIISPSTFNLKADKNNIGKYIMNYFTMKGLTKDHAAAIAGNLFKESSFNVGAVGDKNLSTYSEGIAQWRESRLDNLKNYAKSQNKSYKDLDIQLNFLWKELNSSESKAFESLKNSKTIAEASENFADKFERTSKDTKNRKDRKDYSHYFYNLT